MDIDLIWLGAKKPSSLWLAGQVYLAEPSRAAVCTAAQHSLEQGTAGALLFWDGTIGALPTPQMLQTLLRQPDDLWHSGLQLGMSGQPGMLDFVAPTWMFNRDPDTNLSAASWRISLNACLVRSEVLRQVGFLNPGFETLEAAALEWGHRCIQRGVLCRHHLDLLPEVTIMPSFHLPAADELRFVYHRFGKRWAAWALGRAVLSGYFTGRQALRAAQVLKDEPRPAEPLPFQHAAGETHLPYPLPSVSVLIPTLERYPYLRTLLDQLRQQSLPAAEIIVVDQTPAAQRQADFYAAFKDLPLSLFYQDQPGQCSSRNTGLQAAAGDYVLFIDDDDEIPFDLIEKHQLNLQRFQAEASCGVAREVGAGPLPDAFTYLRASDVFPTNNSLIRISALEKSGLFDLAFERGARADADLGMRLYCSGARMILDPAIDVMHHHAPRGGLRAHKARTITYASSRRRLLHRQLLSPTEIYLAKRYFTPRQVTEMKWISLFATFSLHGSNGRRVLKFILSLLLLPDSLLQMRRSELEARQLLQEHPTIPTRSVCKE